MTDETNNGPVFGSSKAVFGNDNQTTDTTPGTEDTPVATPSVNTNESVATDTTRTNNTPASDEEEYIDLTPPVKEEHPATEETPSKEEKSTDPEQEAKKNKLYLDVLKTNAGFDITTPETYAEVTMQHSPYKEISPQDYAKEFAKREEDIILPTMTIRDFKIRVENYNLNGSEYTQDTDRMNRVFQEQYQMMPSEESLQKTVADDKRSFTQELEWDNVVLRPAQRKFKVKNNAQLTGEAALLRINALRGRGGVFHIPLYHSGFWVTIKSPSDARLLQMEYEFFKSRITLGRAILGAIFTNDQVYLAEMVTDLFKECIYSTSLQSYDDILDIIKIQDLQTIAWGLAAAIYPQGYLYTRAVNDSEGLPGRVAHGIVDIEKLFWVDRNSLTDQQKTHMAKGRNNGSNMTIDSVLAYQEAFKNFKKKIKVAEDMDVLIEAPSIRKFLTSGTEWVEYCIDQANRILETSAGENDRNELINRFYRASLLNQYKHYIAGYTFKPEESNIEELYEDESSIDGFLREYSGDDEIRNTILKGIKDYIEDSLVSIVATPTVDDEKNDSVSKFPHLVPIEALYTFFTFAIRRARRAMSRVNPI